MTTNMIKLSFNNALTGLAGNPFGQSIYQKQVAPYLNPDQINIIAFPENIEDVAISFIQGLFKDIINQYGYEKVKQMIDIEAKDPFSKKKIWDKLY